MFLLVTIIISIELGTLYEKGRITPSEFALWKPKTDIELSFNMATRFLGQKKVSLNYTILNDRSLRQPILSHTLEGKEMLELAKQRLLNMDFVGITSKFMESMEVMSWKLGIPITQLCTCNVNPFKDTNLKLYSNSNSNNRQSSNIKTSFQKYDNIKSSDLTVEALNEVLQDNALDYELYQYAEELFEKDYIKYKDTQIQSNHHNQSFTCHKENMMCRKPILQKKGKNLWLPYDFYLKKYSKAIDKGRHGNCAYDCVRNETITYYGQPQEND